MFDNLLYDNSLLHISNAFSTIFKALHLSIKSLSCFKTFLDNINTLKETKIVDLKFSILEVISKLKSAKKSFSQREVSPEVEKFTVSDIKFLQNVLANLYSNFWTLKEAKGFPNSLFYNKNVKKSSLA